MALINFDCPECGHNLEVDEGGAGFIVKCPECDSPLQIPSLPRARRYRKYGFISAALLAILLLLGANLWVGSLAKKSRQQLRDMETAFADTVAQSQALALAQDHELAAVQEELARVKTTVHATDALGQAALAAITAAESLAQELEAIATAYLKNNTDEQIRLLREDMAKRVASAKNSLPEPPKVSDLPPGQGVQGRLIVFPILLGQDGQKLRENAEITGIENGKISVRFPGGTATYRASELHPGVVAYLPVDPILALPRQQWASEITRIHQTAAARRDQGLHELRAAIEDNLSPPSTP